MPFERMTIEELAEYLELKEKLSPEEEAALRADKRRGTAVLLERFYRRRDRYLKEVSRLQKMLVEENILWENGFTAVAGVDEAGRGPLAGPVVAAAVIFSPGTAIPGLNDSKQLSSMERARIFDQIVYNAHCYAIASASREEIDRFNIHTASILAMRRALQRLTSPPDYVLVDGFKIRDCVIRQKAIKGGDCLSLSIAAASVLAKVARDGIMAELHRRHPRYGFDRNKGYGTAEHRQALADHGPCSEHRRSFRLLY